MKDSMLPPELLWADGHASEVALTALADGQDAIVPDVVRAHVGGCTTCIAHLGKSALLAFATQSAAVRRRVPRLALAMGLALAVLGLLPSIVEQSPAHALSTITRSLASLSGRLGSTFAIVLTYVAAALLVLVGLAFARLGSKKEVSS